MAFLHETMLERCEARDSNVVGQGFMEGFLVVNANGCFG